MNGRLRYCPCDQKFGMTCQDAEGLGPPGSGPLGDVCSATSPRGGHAALPLCTVCGHCLCADLQGQMRPCVRSTLPVQHSWSLF